MSNVKNLIDKIINGSEYPNSKNRTDVHFDKGEFREKLSRFALTDIVSSMMADQPGDMDLDKAVVRHMSRDFDKMSCYDYLIGAKKSCNSPIIGGIIQEIDSTVADVSDKIKETGDTTIETGIDKKELLKNVENYDELREKLKKKVSEQVVNDVANVITKGNDAPTFDGIDDKIEPVDDASVVTESVIMKMVPSVIQEHAIESGLKVNVETGIEMAIVEYCICEMDKLFKMHPKTNNVMRYL